MSDDRPLIVSLQLDDRSQARFDRERAAHFPSGRTVIGAHVTLFHAVPAHRLEDVIADLTDAADRSGFTVEVNEPRSLGRGVAYRLTSDELTALHRRLQRRWSDDLTKQDAQGFRPHITVQNKVTPAVAQATLAELAAGFGPFDVSARGLRLWRYDGGPWEPVQTFEFH